MAKRVTDSGSSSKWNQVHILDVLLKQRVPHTLQAPVSLPCECVVRVRHGDPEAHWALGGSALMRSRQSLQWRLAHVLEGRLPGPLCLEHGQQHKCSQCSRLILQSGWSVCSTEAAQTQTPTEEIPLVLESCAPAATLTPSGLFLHLQSE